MMDNALHYLAVNRQRGLSAELSAIANNIANMSTPGFRREGSVFAEFVTNGGTAGSISMADMQGRFTDTRAGQIEMTGGRFDLALQGDGFFVVENQGRQMLTRAGNFLRTETGELATQDGARVLDQGRAPIIIPPDVTQISIAPDGTVSADGAPLAQLAVVTASELEMSREGATVFATEGATPSVPVPRVMQGALERSNVDPVFEMTRLIEVTRAYESVQSLIEDEDERIRGMLDTLARR